MKRKVWDCVAAGSAMAGLLFCSGCKTPSWFTAGTNSSGTSLPVAAAGSASGLSGAPMNTDATGLNGLAQQAHSTTDAGTTGSVVLASFSQAGKKLSQAMMFAPSVTAAVDPVKLDNQPADVAKVAADLHYHAGYFFETQQKFSEAASHYKEVLAKSPQDARALGGYGRALAGLGNIVEAEQFLKQACQQAPSDAGPHHDLAQFYRQQRQLDAAISCERQAVQFQPTHPQYRSSLAQLLLDSGNRDEAIQHLSAVYGEAMAHFQLGGMLNERRQPELARQHLDRSVALNPSLAPAREALERLSHATFPPHVRGDGSSPLR